MNRNPIAQLRDMVPLRPLTGLEAHAIAERQATMLLELLGVDHRPVPEALLTGLPRLEVSRRSPWFSSGASQWINGRWLIILNANEPATRQRFSLAHELKHIIDHRFIDTIYQRVPEAQRARFIEATCDYFAGCLLMPKAWLKRAYTTDTQAVDRLARRFNVSEAAMATRLRQIGLTDPTPRCEPPVSPASRRAVANRAWDYLRESTPVTTLSAAS